MALGHLGHLNQIDCDERTHNVAYVPMLRGYAISSPTHNVGDVPILTSMLFASFVLCIHLCNILNYTVAKSLVGGVFWDLVLFLSSFSAILLGAVIAQKNERF